MRYLWAGHVCKTTGTAGLGSGMAQVSMSARLTSPRLGDPRRAGGQRGPGSPSRHHMHPDTFARGGERAPSFSSNSDQSWAQASRPILSGLQASVIT